jgi:hypothetical protein
LAIKLIEQGVPQKEIAKQSHLSFSSIAKIRRSLEGDTIENTNKPKSIQAQTFKLFLKNKSLVSIAIELDLSEKRCQKSILII